MTGLRGHPHMMSASRGGRGVAKKQINADEGEGGGSGNFGRPLQNFRRSEIGRRVEVCGCDC